MKVLGLITARGGSKGIPGKNLKLLAGRPLLAYTIDAAQRSRLDRVVLSTEDPEIAAVGRALGCEVPFMRPSELSRDDTPHLPVIQHGVRTMIDLGYHADAVMTLQPTSPLRTAADIDASLNLLESSGADSVLSVSEVGAHAHPLRMLKIDAQGFATLFATGEPVRRRINRRQDLPPAHLMNGAVYVCLTRCLFAAEPTQYGDRVAAYAMPATRSISIDDLEDWAACERALAGQLP